MLIKQDPLRNARNGINRIPQTGIYFRAYNGSLNQWQNLDIAELDRDSLYYVLTTLWGTRENLAKLLLFYMGHTR